MLLFCVKTIVKMSHNFELVRLKKKKEKHFGCLATLVRYFCNAFLSTTGCGVLMKTLEDKQYIVLRCCSRMSVTNYTMSFYLPVRFILLQTGGHVMLAIGM